MARKKISNEPLKPPDISDPLFPYGPKNKHLQGVLGIRKDAKKRGGDTYQTPVSLEEEYEKEIQETIAEISAAHNIINSDDESKVRLSKRYNESKNIVEEELEKIEEQFRSASEIAETSKTESDILNNKELDWLEENKILTEAPHVDYSEFPELAVFDPTNSGVLDFSLELLPPRLFQRYRRGFNFFYNGKRYYVSTKSSVIEPFDPAKDTWKRPVFDEWQDYVNIRDRYVPKYNTIKVSTNSAKKRKLIIKINENKTKIPINEGLIDTLKNIGSKVRDFLSLTDVFSKLNLAPYFSAIKQGYEYVKNNPNEVKKNVEILTKNEPSKIVKEAIDPSVLIGPTFIKTMALTSLGMYAYHVMKVVSFVSGGGEDNVMDFKDSLETLLKTNPVDLVRKAAQTLRMSDSQLNDPARKIEALEASKELLGLAADVTMT